MKPLSFTIAQGVTRSVLPMRSASHMLTAIGVLIAAPAAAHQERAPTGQWLVVQGPGAGAERAAIASFGPFRVLGPTRAAIVGTTDARTPTHFAAMLAAFPSIAVLEMLECPGTFDDRANFELGRMIRDAGIATHVPNGGSVRSGAVELFLAGKSRLIDDGAEFAVHSWLDQDGREADDYGPDSPENRRYLDYYREMGMSAEQATAFYAMTNSVPFERALWLTGAEMRRWLPEESAGSTLARLDLGRPLN